MAWFNEWWVWMVAALVLGILEVIIPGWIFFGFAVGAFFMGSMIWLGIGAGLSLAWSPGSPACCAFGVMSLAFSSVTRVSPAH